MYSNSCKASFYPKMQQQLPSGRDKIKIVIPNIFSGKISFFPFFVKKNRKLTEYWIETFVAARDLNLDFEICRVGSLFYPSTWLRSIHAAVIEWIWPEDTRGEARLKFVRMKQFYRILSDGVGSLLAHVAFIRWLKNSSFWWFVEQEVPAADSFIPQAMLNYASDHYRQHSYLNFSLGALTPSNFKSAVFHTFINHLIP